MKETPRRAPARTGLVCDDAFLRHDTGFGHPERPARITAIMSRLEGYGLLPRLLRIAPEPAPLEWIHAIHDPTYVERVRAGCRNGESHVDSPDCPISRESYDVAMLAAGGLLKAADAVMDGTVRNAFCAVRPPGHHALRDRAMGFCLFNSVAITARYLQKRHGLARILIVDWDVHHGNGTQAAFYADPTVLYYSSHRYPFYPGTGSSAEKGTSSGIATTINAPLAMGSGDKDFIDALRYKLLPRLETFHPDAVIVSAGFDAHESDPLGGMVATAEGFAEMTRIVKNIAECHGEGRLISALEGGYDLDGLAEAVEAHIRVLME